MTSPFSPPATTGMSSSYDPKLGGAGTSTALYGGVGGGCPASGSSSGGAGLADSSTMVKQEVPDSGYLETTEMLARTVMDAHLRTSLYTQDHIEQLRMQGIDTHRTLQYKSMAHDQFWTDISDKLTSVIQLIIEFAKMIPGFMKLSQDDQIMLLKAGSFELSLIRMAQSYDLATNKVLYGETYIPAEVFTSKDPVEQDFISRVFSMAKTLVTCHLTEQEVALYSATVLVAPDRPGLHEVGTIQALHDQLVSALKDEMELNHGPGSTSQLGGVGLHGLPAGLGGSGGPGSPDVDALLTKLLRLIPELRQLSSQHCHVLQQFRARNPHIEFPALHKELFSTDT